MAVIPELTWTHYKEVYPGNAVSLTQYKELLWKIVVFLKAAGAVIVRSSDGAGNFASSDLWVDSSKLKWDSVGSNHSWAVWYFRGRYFLMNCSNAEYNLFAYFSDSSFSVGGSATTAPTAASARSILIANNDLVWCGQNQPNRQFSIHGMYCSTAIRLFVSYGGNTGTYFCMDEPTDVRGVPQPAFCGLWGKAASSCTAAIWSAAGPGAVSTAVTGFAQAGGSTTQIPLAVAQANVQNDYYKDWLYEAVGGPGDGEQKTVTAYDAATNTITVAAGTIPTTATEYMLNPRVRSTAISPAYMNAGPMLGPTTSDDWDVGATGTPGPGTWPFDPIRVYANTTGNRWDRGRLRDIYWGPSANANGQLFDTDLTRDWVQYGNFVVPNDGAPAPVT